MEDEIATRPVRLRINPITDLRNCSENEVIAIGVNDVGVQYLILDGCDITGGIIMRTANACWPEESADKPCRPRVINAQAPIVAVHERGPAFSRVPITPGRRGGGKMSQCVAREGCVAGIADQLPKLAD